MIKYLTGDCIEVLKTLDPESVHCCVTSPPYWGLRDYGTATWEGGDPKCDHNTFRGKPRPEKYLKMLRTMMSVKNKNISKLEAEAKELRTGLHSQDIAVSTLSEMNTKLEVEIGRLKKRNESLKKDNAYLEEQVEIKGEP